MPDASSAAVPEAGPAESPGVDDDSIYGLKPDDDVPSATTGGVHAPSAPPRPRTAERGAGPRRAKESDDPATEAMKAVLSGRRGLVLAVALISAISAASIARMGTRAPKNDLAQQAIASLPRDDRVLSGPVVEVSSLDTSSMVSNVVPGYEVRGWTDTTPLAQQPRRVRPERNTIRGTSFLEGERFWNVEVGTSARADWSYHADVVLPERKIRPTKSRSVLVFPLLADMNGPFAVVAPERPDDRPLFARSELDVTVHDQGSDDGYAVIDLRTNQRVGSFPCDSPLWQSSCRMSPDGRYVVGPDAVPEQVRDAKQALFVWERDESNGPKATIPLSGILFWMSFVSNDEIALLVSHAEPQTPHIYRWELEVWTVDGSMKRKHFVVDHALRDAGSRLDLSEISPPRRISQFVRAEPIPAAISPCGRLVALRPTAGLGRRLGLEKSACVFVIDLTADAEPGVLKHDASAIAFSEDGKELVLVDFPAGRESNSSVQSAWVPEGWARVAYRDARTGKLFHETTFPAGGLRVEQLWRARDPFSLIVGPRRDDRGDEKGAYVDITGRHAPIALPSIARWSSDGASLVIGHPKQRSSGGWTQLAIFASDEPQARMAPVDADREEILKEEDRASWADDPDRRSVTRVDSSPPSPWKPISAPENPTPTTRAIAAHWHEPEGQMLPFGGCYRGGFQVFFQDAQSQSEGLSPGGGPLRRSLAIRDPNGPAVTVIDPEPFAPGRMASLVELCLAMNVGNELCAFTKPAMDHKRVDIHRRVGDEFQFVRAFHPYGTAVRPQDLSWVGSNRLVTLGEGRLTVWDADNAKVLVEIAGEYRKPMALAIDGSWAAVSRGRSVDILNLESGECLARLAHSCIDKVLGVTVSPDQKLIATAVVDGAARMQILVWDLQSGKFAFLPTSTDSSRQMNRIENGPVTDFTMFWVGPRILVNSQASGHNIIDLDGGRLTRTSGELPVPLDKEAMAKVNRLLAMQKGPPLRVCVAYPSRRASEMTARRIAKALAEEGCTIGPGGNTLTVVAGWRLTKKSDGTVLGLETDSCPWLPLPTVDFRLVMTDPKGAAIASGNAAGHFLNAKSRFFRTRPNERNGEWELPSDYKTAVIEEILERSVNVVDAARTMVKANPCLLFRLVWCDAPKPP